MHRVFPPLGFRRLPAMPKGPNNYESLLRVRVLLGHWFAHTIAHGKSQRAGERIRKGTATGGKKRKSLLYPFPATHRGENLLRNAY